MTLCPICFEKSTDVCSYEQVYRHSWSNEDRCDGHGCCWSCIQRHVEVKLLHQGIWNVRCPGEGCAYRLLEQDIHRALRSSRHRDRAMQVYNNLRNANGRSRLRSALSLALAEGPESWLWSQSQACPKCFILAYRDHGCDHLVCRCGCDYCFVCGGYMYGPDSTTVCCCREFHLPRHRSYLAAWLCLKSGLADEALGECAADVDASLCLQTPYHHQLAERARASEERARLQEQALEEWAQQTVRSTREALQLRGACESLGAALWSAGADVPAPWEQHGSIEDASARVLACSVAAARAEEQDEFVDQEAFAEDFDFDDVVGYLEDHRCARALRRLSQGAPRRSCKEKLWVAGEKMQARAPAHAKRQRRAVVADARCSISEARRLRTMRRLHCGCGEA